MTAIEVDVGGPLNDAKLRDYAESWFDLDAEGWLLRLVCVDRYGRDVEMDLCSWWFQYNCAEGASPDWVNKAQISMNHLRAPAFDARPKVTDEQAQTITAEFMALWMAVLHGPPAEVVE